MAIGPRNTTGVAPSPEVLAEVRDIESLLDRFLETIHRGGDYASTEFMGSFPSFRVRAELARRYVKAGWALVEFHRTSANSFHIGLGAAS